MVSGAGVQPRHSDGLPLVGVAGGGRGPDGVGAQWQMKVSVRHLNEVGRRCGMAGKLGEGHVAAMGRLGLKELRNALNPSRESVADAEIGLYGTATQGEIAGARGGPSQGPEQESLSLSDL